MFLTKLVSSFEIQIVSININYVQAFFLVLVVSKWLARFSTICMRDGFVFVSFIVKNMFKSAACCRWVIKCFTQCMVLDCILCSKINLKYFFYEVIKSKAWIYSYCVYLLPPLWPCFFHHGCEQQIGSQSCFWWVFTCLSCFISLPHNRRLYLQSTWVLFCKNSLCMKVY